ncbi:hypothetical protein [Chryseobacterium vrystaatense]|uniref:Lipoprotein n=1 Tax=Chryseobacterium vrystaatense TaxID=307480 RepID=A0ABR4UII4_9FLAO|nr:hypothetical protein [Chryseobacterium vrystaatense]KFF24354.1 hypothetical protein IW16_21030 [Chryseobacterium vrystaatense]
MKNLVPALALLSLVYCKEKPQQEQKAPVQKVPAEAPQAELIKDTVYTEFKPEIIRNLNIKGFDVGHAFSLEGYKIASGNYKPVDGNITLPDTEEDWGNRLLLLNDNNQVTYQSKGFGEAYLYEPYFYKNSQNDNIIIVCQQAFEYFFGGEAFLFEKGKMKYLGNLDIEPNNMEIKLTDILKIKESKDGITFTFDSDSLVLQPGSKDRVIKNNNVKYVYDHQSLKLHQ